MNSETIIVQPFYNWKGHYKKYTDELELNVPNAFVVIAGVGEDLCGDNNKRYVVNSKLDSSNLYFTLFRILNPLLCFIYSLRHMLNVKNIISVEFNPLVFLLYSLTSLIFKFRYIQIVHNFTPERGNMSKLKVVYLNVNEILIKLFPRSLVIVHSKAHYENLLKCRTSSLYSFYFEYPTDGMKVQPSDISNRWNNKLVFTYVGLIRKDKDMGLLANFCREINKNCKKEYVINIAGYPKDFEKDEIISLFKGIKNVNFKLEYLSNDEVDALLVNSHYFLLPYNKEHNTTIGPLKMAFSYGLVCIGSECKMFDIDGAPRGAILNLMKKGNNNFFELNEPPSIDKSIQILRYAEMLNWDNFSKKIASLLAV